MEKGGKKENGEGAREGGYLSENDTHLTHRKENVKEGTTGKALDCSEAFRKFLQS